MVGMATLTMVTSSSAMNCPVIRTASMSQRRRSVVSPPPGMVVAVVMPTVCVGLQRVTRSLVILVSPAPGTTDRDAAH
jgi:hypothetical protein